MSRGIPLSTMESESPLPYTDTKPVGAADFFLAVNSTFRFILQKRGMDSLREYWTDLGTHYFAPVSKTWQRGGLNQVAAYWKAFFAAEPGALVNVLEEKDLVTLEVKTCPAIALLREKQREILPCFCQHCYYVSEAMAKPAGLTVRIEGGNGSCRQVFLPRQAAVSEQDLSQIKEAAC